MVELLKKTAFAGIGLAFMTKEKAEDAAKRIVAEAKIAEDEGKRFVDDLVRKADEARVNIEKLIDGGVHAALARLDMPTRTEFRALQERVKELEVKENKVY
jgi:polyhydroxyalkanoate synthesis regulator phasin